MKSDDHIRREGLKSFLSREETVRAVLYDYDHNKLSLATVGPYDEEVLRNHLAEALTALEVAFASLGQQALESDQEAHSLIHVKELPHQTLMEKQTCPSGPLFWRWRELPWPDLHRDSEEPEDWRVLGLLAGLCGILSITAFALTFLSGIPGWIISTLYILAMVAGGWDAAGDAASKLKRAQLDIHFLMIAVAIGAALIGAFGEGALLLFLFSFAGALEHYALHRTRREIRTLMDAAPKQATRIHADGTESQVPVESLTTGEIIGVRPGDVFPVDADITEGRTAADESTLTGEATPVPKEPGDPVFSGTVNLWGSVKARVTHKADQSALQKIIRLIQQAQHLKAPSQKFTDYFGTGYTWAVLGATTLMFFIWWQGFDLPAFDQTTGVHSAFYRAMTLLVVASPCALVLSIPSAILAAIAWGARNGVLFRGGAAVEKLAQIHVVALDKTGTLTTGDLEVIAVESLPPGREEAVASLAFSLENHSTHPIARAISTYGKKKGLTPTPVHEFRNLSGKGVKGKVGEAFCALGRRELLERSPLKDLIDRVDTPPATLTEVWVVHDGLLGRLLLQDRIRPESSQALSAIRQAGMKPVMLTGDRRDSALEVARIVGLKEEEVRAGLSPEGKVAAIRELKQGGRNVAMVGDGVNDAPSLAVADVSIAMGARGSDSALEQSEVILMEDRIENFLAAHRLSCRARTVIRQNLTIALGTVVIMVLCSIAGLVPLTVGVFAHEGSTVLVCLNSLRLLFTGSAKIRGSNPFSYTAGAM